MNDEPTFDPERSRAIRQSLVETVAAEPARRRRTRHVRVLAGIIVVAVLTAGGTTAIALGGGALFTPATAPSTGTPAPVPPTALPTTPPITSTADPNPVPAVASSPIAPHDVLSSPAGALWSTDLLGSDESCVQHYVYSVSDGYALFQSGPKITAGDEPDPCDLTDNGVTLTLVDTTDGTQAWSRNWSWDGGPSRDVGVDTLVLGTSGRILINTQEPGFGPEEVLDLSTGSALGSLTLTDGESVRQVQAVAGDSGEVIAMIETVDSRSNTTGPSRVARFDPRDAAHPVWSTSVEGWLHNMRVVTKGLGYTALTYSPTGGQTAPAPGLAPSVDSVLNLTTGEISPRSEELIYDFFTGYTIRLSDVDDSGSALTLTGLDDGGNQLWTRSIPTGSDVVQVTTPLVRPGSSDLVGNGQFLIESPGALTLVDGLTGNTVWSTKLDACTLTETGALSSGALAVSDGPTLLVNGLPDAACRFAATSGAPLADPSRALWTNAGLTATYELRDGRGTATNVQSNEVLWSISSDASSWLFAGGRLVARTGNTISGLG
ncbi:hypothetical protein B7R22_13520 [Subtercola boreus]|uniref:Pyrrolo-quinoline quinone n=1 Tax=Subtercola boreus TaxID=120213 RepID=A0A3E0VV01_9MICO|nr:PQQ-binding-like beta-propeller repeat protein [Subtercola boreus]RFA13666.1 hypothetical protein B7R22_13520 [Subtercola boreus]